MSQIADREIAGKGGSLTLRLALAFALIFALGGVAVAVAAFSYGRQAAQQSFDRLLVGAADQIARSITLQDGAVSVDLPVGAFELLSLAPEDRVIYAVYGADGGLVTGYEGLEPFPEGRRFHDATFAGEPIRAIRVTRPFAEQSYAGTVEVVVGHTLRARAEMAAQITRNAVIAAGLVALVMAGLAVLAVRAALAPVNRVGTALQGRSPQNLTPLDVAVPREISSLVQALNRFMGRLDRQVGIMRNLIADASHQLRTPIAALRVQAELAEEENDPEALRRIVHRIHARAVNLSHLTDQLLNHALIIHRADSVPLARVDLRQVVIDAIEHVDHAVRDGRTAAMLDLPEDPVWCDGDALSLIEATKNLAGNALRHGVDPVRVSVAQDGDRARILVRDAGPGIPHDYWDEAGTRFARSSGVSAKSAGLGLAIVQSVAAAHHGRLEFRTGTPSGFEAAIVLPLAENGAR
ncbi:sensor histidine kinase N-terminal domain-containing protein [Paracoccus sp. R12_1]|uniref:sensor histidine kinase n=1 Tax=unclassified Paracoccus (in: a-proteobacteria) TaxID=2688777 RepID=UPI001ADAE79B|nr:MULTISPECIES: sensor histidine kinase N-terminal domain-containing protein [unclassified Paracoccus (in: a-proteobacteria)]MBO9454258.1 sensor histidine kinase N-terminal domain-containing protein [Paracoccus sp. R12_2]MBO9485044.1 sensor histidine kinase N-terminal domain-containing protein [Paracoccus sp. R12_1]